MKKIVKLSSLGLVALLASCGNKAATPLKKVSPETAISVADSIGNQRSSERNSLYIKDKDAKANPFYSSKIFPYSKTKVSADIEINYVVNSESPYNHTEESDTIKKHLFFDMDHLYCHGRVSHTHKDNSGLTYNYPEINYYAFFIEDEKQDEEAIETKYDIVGTYYILQNIGNVIKQCVINPGEKKDKTEYIGVLTNSMRLFQENNSDAIVSSVGVVNLEKALSYDLFNVHTNLGLTKYYIDNYTDVTFPTIQDYDETLFMDEMISDFENAVDGCIELKEAFEELETEGIYFNYVFKSNDAKTLGLDTDLGYSTKNDTMSQTITQSSSFTMRDLYLTESHLTTTNSGEMKDAEGKVQMAGSQVISIDQTINYSPSDKVDIPSDYLDYAVGF